MANVEWHWTPNGYLAGLIAVGAGYVASLVLNGLIDLSAKALVAFAPSKRTGQSEADVRVAERAIHCADTAGKIMNLQWKTAANLNFRDIKGKSVAEPSAAFAYGLLLTALELNGIKWSQESIHPEAAFMLVAHFASQWRPDDTDNKEMAAFILDVGLNPSFQKYRQAGEAAFKRFHENLNQEFRDEDFVRSTNDLSQVLGLYALPPSFRGFEPPSPQQVPS
jgi:hypothetical protein